MFAEMGERNFHGTENIPKRRKSMSREEIENEITCYLRKFKIAFLDPSKNIIALHYKCELLLPCTLWKNIFIIERCSYSMMGWPDARVKMNADRAIL